MCNSPTISTASCWCKYIFKTHELFSFQKQTDKKTKRCLPSRKCVLLAWPWSASSHSESSSAPFKVERFKNSCQTIIHVPHPPLTLYYAHPVLRRHVDTRTRTPTHTFMHPSPFAPHLPVRPTFNDAKERTSETGKQKEWNVASANEVEVIHGRKRRGEEFWMQYVFKGRNLHNLWQMIDRTGRGGKGEQGGRRKWMSEEIL